MADERFEVSRPIDAAASTIFAVLRDPKGHVLIDGSGSLQWSEDLPVSAVGDTFVVHMDRESLNDIPLGKYDATVLITGYEQDALIEWTVMGADPPINHVYGYRLEPSAEGTLVTTYYDWSQVPQSYRGMLAFPVIPEKGLRATLGILARTVESHG